MDLASMSKPPAGDDKPIRQSPFARVGRASAGSGKPADEPKAESPKKAKPEPAESPKKAKVKPEPESPKKSKPAESPKKSKKVEPAESPKKPKKAKAESPKKSKKAAAPESPKASPKKPKNILKKVAGSDDEKPKKSKNKKIAESDDDESDDKPSAEEKARAAKTKRIIAEIRGKRKETKLLDLEAGKKGKNHGKDENESDLDKMTLSELETENNFIAPEGPVESEPEDNGKAKKKKKDAEETESDGEAAEVTESAAEEEENEAHAKSAKKSKDKDGDTKMEKAAPKKKTKAEKICNECGESVAGTNFGALRGDTTGTGKRNVYFHDGDCEDSFRAKPKEERHAQCKAKKAAAKPKAKEPKKKESDKPSKKEEKKPAATKKRKAEDAEEPAVAKKVKFVKPDEDEVRALVKKFKKAAGNFPDFMDVLASKVTPAQLLEAMQVFVPKLDFIAEFTETTKAGKLPSWQFSKEYQFDLFFFNALADAGALKTCEKMALKAIE